MTHPSNLTPHPDDVADLFVCPSPGDIRVVQIADAGETMVRWILRYAPDSMDRSVAIRKVREAWMTAALAIACDP